MQQDKNRNTILVITEKCLLKDTALLIQENGIFSLVFFFLQTDTNIEFMRTCDNF